MLIIFRIKNRPHPDAGADGGKMKRTPLIITLCLCLAGAGLYFGLSRGAGAAAPTQATAVVRRMDLEDVVTSLGKLEPATYVDVGAQVSGQLMKLHVDLSSVVEKGDLVAEIDPRLHTAKVEQDKATIANLEASLAERKATLAQADRNYKRDQELRRQNAASELALQNSETQYKVAKAQVTAVEAQLRQARANLESDELNLSYCRIYAPIAGTVVSLPVREGQTLNANQTTPTLMRIADLEVMTVWASVSEADIGKLSPGMSVYFTTVGDTATRYHGVVDKIHPSYTEENDVILYDVVFDVKNPDKIFLPAMNTQVFFVRAEARGVLGLSLDALPQSQKAATSLYLTVVKADGKEERRDVRLGARTRAAVEVVSGLNEGERVKLPSAGSGTGGGPRMPGGMGPRL